MLDSGHAFPQILPLFWKAEPAVLTPHCLVASLTLFLGHYMTFSVIEFGFFL